ncbi:MAG: IS4 family transposase [Chloroflexota bacterium]|nr:IS4 family transposase [Chloroflexota bacterium]
MGFIARSYDTTVTFTDTMALEALERVVSADAIRTAAAIAAVPTQRRRKLPTDVTLLLCIGMSLFTAQALDVVLATLTHGLRLFWPDPEPALATKGAISQARYRLGARPVVALFHQVCRPLATLQTPGAFLFGLRVMAIDGTVEDVPDSPANVRAFGRHHADRGDSAFPQVQGVYLSECATHAVIDAVFWPCHVAERRGAFRLLRRVSAGMLLLLDRGFYSFAMIERTRATGAHVLGRVPSTVTLRVRHLLPDGSYWAYIYPADRERKKRGDHLLVRVIVYTLTDPARPGYGETHRLVTTLLDAQQAPALDLIMAYHERWEIELTIDEIDTHQRLVRHPLRSPKPVGVIQELYGLLIAHYAVRALMAEAAATADLAPTRLSFVHAVALIRVALDDFQLVTPIQHDRLYQRLLRDIAACTLPARAPRTNPRVVKRKMSKFLLKRRSPSPASQHLGAFADAIHLLPQPAPAHHGLDDPSPCEDARDPAWLLSCPI